MASNGDGQHAPESGSASASGPIFGTDPVDPLKQVRQLKRWCQIGVYGAILSILPPVMVFLLHLSALQWLLSIALGLLIATAAIDLAFRQIFRLDKRSIYPALLAVALSAAEAPAVAGQQGLSVAVKLLNLHSGFLALKSEQAAFAVSAAVGLDPSYAERLLRAGMIDVRHALQAGQPVPLSSNPNQWPLVDVGLNPHQLLLFVPVVSLEATIGVLGLLGQRNNENLKDAPLLQGIGRALGLSLDNLRQKEELRQLAAIDDLTGVYNRRYFFEQLEREVAEARRYNGRLAILLVDLDGLKRLNDRFGHWAGDQALRAVAQRLVLSSRGADVVARLGGDEFALILPRTGRQGAQELALRLAEAIAAQTLDVGHGPRLELSVSCGVAAFPVDGDDIEALLQAADASMYTAKLAKQEVQAR